MKNVIAIVVVVIVVVIIIAVVRRGDDKPQQPDVAVPEQPAPAQPKPTVADTPDREPEAVAEKAPQAEPVQIADVSTDVQEILDDIPMYENSEVIESTFNNGQATRVFEIEPVVASGDDSYETTVTKMVDYYKKALEEDGWEIGELHIMRDLHPVGGGQGDQQPTVVWRNKRHFEAKKGGRSINYTIDQSFDAEDQDEIKIVAKGYINVK